MVSALSEQSNTLPRTQKPGRTRDNDGPSTSAAVNEGYLMVSPGEQKARFVKSKRSRTRSERRPSSVGFEPPDHDAPPPPLTPRTTSAGELTRYSTLPRIAESSETPASPIVSNGSYFESYPLPESSRTITAGQSATLDRRILATKSHRKTHSYHNIDDLNRVAETPPPLQYADVPQSGVNGVRRLNRATGGWYLDQSIELQNNVDYDQPGPSRIRPISQHSGRVAFSVPSTPQKESMEAAPLLVSDLHDGDVRIELPQVNPSYQHPSIRHRLKHLDLVNFFVLADWIDYSALAATGFLIAAEIFIVHLLVLVW